MEGNNHSINTFLQSKLEDFLPKGLVISKKLALYLGFYILLLTLPFLLRLASPTLPAQLIPSVWIVALWALPLAVLYRTRNIYAQFLSIIWIGWFIVGSINIAAAYVYYGEYYLIDASLPALIYILFTFVFVIGIAVFEKIILPLRSMAATSKIRLYKRSSLTKINPVFGSFLILFPFIWFVSLYLSLGYLPLLIALQGINLTAGLYELNYGPLYGFALVIVLSILYVLDKSQNNSKTRWVYIILLLVYILFTITTGKRHILVLSMVAVLVYLFHTTHVSLSKVLILLSILIGLYAGLLIIREGVNTSAYASVAGKLVITGGEYRVFAYVADRIKPGQIPNYDWASSAIASMVNNKILSLFNINKDELVMTGSAYTWGPIFSTTAGIRSGIISELYMAYGYFGLVILFLFGVITAWVGHQLVMTHSVGGLIFSAVVYSMFIVSIVGQTTDTTGGLTILLYAWIIYLLTRMIPLKKRNSLQ